MSAEINCQNCEAACCRGDEIMSLTLQELSFMLRGGNKFLTVVQPEDRDREKVIYPRAHEIDPDSHRPIWLVEKGNEYEPLPAGYGRYVLQNECAYLVRDESGWPHCGVYDERPAVCSSFEMGGQKCSALRIQYGVDVPIELTTKSAPA